MTNSWIFSSHFYHKPLNNLDEVNTTTGKPMHKFIGIMQKRHQEFTQKKIEKTFCCFQSFYYLLVFYCNKWWRQCPWTVLSIVDFSFISKKKTLLLRYCAIAVSNRIICCKFQNETACISVIICIILYIVCKHSICLWNCLWPVECRNRILLTQ